MARVVTVSGVVVLLALSYEFRIGLLLLPRFRKA